jgi:hypothetical protein
VLAQARTPTLPLPETGFTTTGKPIARPAAAASTAVVTTRNSGVGRPAARRARRCHDLSRAARTFPASGPASPKRAASAAAVAMKYSELEVTPAIRPPKRASSIGASASASTLGTVTTSGASSSSRKPYFSGRVVTRTGASPISRATRTKRRPVPLVLLSMNRRTRLMR